MTLQGPADANNYRVKVGRFGDRWYTDPLPACGIAPASDWQGPSVSATKPPFANKYVTMKSVAEMTSDEWHRLADLDADARYEAIKAHEKIASRINMDRGAIVHARAEDHLNGWVGSLSVIGSEVARQKAERFFPALDAFLNDYQPELIAAETVCLHRTLNGVGYGGTADAFVKIDGAVWAVDWKSRNSDHDAYLEEGAQGGAYIGAEYMIVAGDDGAPMRVRPPEVAGVLIVSIREDGYRAFPIDGAAAIDGYRAMHAWWCAQRHYVDRKAKGRPWAPKVATPTPDDTNEAQTITPVVHSKADVIARYMEMSAGDKELFKAHRAERNIDNDDAAALWALLDDIDYLRAPDEGDRLDDATTSSLRNEYDALGDIAASWFADLLAQSRNGHSWELGRGARTVRRFEIYRGLIRLAGWDEFDRRLTDDNPDVFNTTVLIPLVWAALGHYDPALFPSTRPGVAVGLLNATQAAEFSQLVDALIAGRIRTVVDETTPDRWRIDPAA